MIKEAKWRHTARMQEKKSRKTKKKNMKKNSKNHWISQLTFPHELRKTNKHKAWAPLQIVHATRLQWFGWDTRPIFGYVCPLYWFNCYLDFRLLKGATYRKKAIWKKKIIIIIIMKKVFFLKIDRQRGIKRAHNRRRLK